MGLFSLLATLCLLVLMNDLRGWSPPFIAWIGWFALRYFRKPPKPSLRALMELPYQRVASLLGNLWKPPKPWVCPHLGWRLPEPPSQGQLLARPRPLFCQCSAQGGCFPLSSLLAWAKMKIECFFYILLHFWSNLVCFYVCPYKTKNSPKPMEIVSFKSYF
jgi:hypothetical protein